MLNVFIWSYVASFVYLFILLVFCFFDKSLSDRYGVDTYGAAAFAFLISVLPVINVIITLCVVITNCDELFSKRIHK